MADDERPVRPNPVRDLAAAVGFLTVLPFGRVWREGREPRGVGFYPWVGWILGGAAGGALLALTRLAGHPPRTAAALGGALVVAGWALLTRFLHWDGLADSADGVLGGSTPERRLEIMRDSRIGSFGAAAVVMVALVQVSAAGALVARGLWWVLVAAPVIGRAAASAAAWTLPAARREGLGLSVVRRPGTYDLVVWAIGTASVAALFFAGAPVRPLATTCMAGLAAAVLVPSALARPVGGVTGDVLGASVLLVEIVVLVTGVVAS